MQYIMVLIEMDSNAILVKAMQNRISGEMVQSYQKPVVRLKLHGISPNMHILDNKCSTEFKETILKNGMKYQLVPPHDHRRNITEKAIQKFKDDFVAVLCGAAVNFSMGLWCPILRQAKHQLNLLRKSRVNAEKSSFEVLYGKHDYNANPFAILGSAVEAHNKPSKRKTFEAHTKAGFYLGNLWEHYR